MRAVLCLLLFITTITGVLSSCTREDNSPPNLPKNVLLTYYTWKQVGYAIDRNFDESYDQSEWVPVTNYNLYLKFNQGGNGTCHKTYPGYDNTCNIQWGYLSNDTSIFIHSQELNDTYGFQSINANSLVLKNNDTYPHSWMIFGH